MKDVLAVVDEKGVVATAVDVTGWSDRKVEKMTYAYLMRIDRNRFLVHEGKRKKLPVDGDKW